MKYRLIKPLIALIASVLMLSGPLLAQAGCVENMLSLANQHRHTALILSGPLTQVAQHQAQNMAWSDDLSGDLPVSEIEAAGYTKSRLGLIAAAGHRSPAEAIRYWMNSQSRDDILDKNYTDVGIGCAFEPSSSYQYYWVVIFGGELQSQAGYAGSRFTQTTQERQTSLLTLTNQKRRAALVYSQLAFSEQLTQVAQRMAQNPHSRLQGDLPSSEIRAAGYSKSHLGLILAAGYSSPAEVLNFWMDSQSGTILDKSFTDIGIGYVFDSFSPYRHHWVVIFGGEQQSQAGYAGSRFTQTTQERQIAQKVLALTNVKRRTALRISEQLTQVAQQMAQNPRSRLKAVVPVDKIQATGYGKPQLGLIIAAGYRSPAEVLNYWMRSQSRTLLDESFTDVGIGYVLDSSSRYRHHWVVIFGGGQSQAPRTDWSSDITSQEPQTTPKFGASDESKRPVAPAVSGGRQPQTPRTDLGSNQTSQEPQTTPKFGASDESKRPTAPAVSGDGRPQTPRTDLGSNQTSQEPQTTPKFGASDESKRPTAPAVSGDGRPQTPRTDLRSNQTSQEPQTTPKFGASDESKRPTAPAVSGDGRPTERRMALMTQERQTSLLTLTNQKRRAAFIYSQLAFSEQLNQVAQRMVQDPNKRLEGDLPSAEIRAMGYRKSRLGLILAAGYSSPTEVLNFWMDSQSGTILDESFTDVGIGYVFDPASTYRHYWVVIFGGD